jgi:hypothetical protein
MTRESCGMENYILEITFLMLAEEAVLLHKQSNKYVREVLTNEITTWSRVVLEKLIVSHLLEKLPPVTERHIYPFKCRPLAPILSQINPDLNLPHCCLR